MNTELAQTTNWDVGSMTQMTSREIAELTGKQLQHVNRDVLAMLNELSLDASSFGRIYLDTLNRQKTEYVLDQELTFTLVTGYSIKLRNAVIKRWLDLEHQVVSLQAELNKWCAKENCDKAIGSLHGKGLAERKKTKHLNTTTIDGILKKMQLKLEV
ncbi:Rha family transcriptional regulator [Psychrobacter nivimaris]|uniref:Rha family transcriptional regulator n=1 Tax=Psychrobacter nivimaris TaxID=281738 RepID=UPI0019183FD9|nr:Rha family transcriptional regulator [Psychrobacter nivimaris]|tara:strand:+ start:572 stop:1042 length:471 start_codon:yes stop_codon:yes gene_type:complete